MKTTPSRREYDPATCVTAGELRELGFPIPASIPDVAWCLRSSLVPKLKDVQGSDGEYTIHFTIEFMKPLEWIQMDFVIDPTVS